MRDNKGGPLVIQVTCRGCGERLKVKEDRAGKRVKCPQCGDPVQIPRATESDPAMQVASTPSAPFVDVPAPTPLAPPQPPPQPPKPPRTPAPPRRPAPSAEYNPFANEPDPREAFGDLAHDDTGSRRKPRGMSSARRWATHGAIVGAVAAAVTFALVQPGEAPLVEACQRLAPKAEPEAIRGVLWGTMAGLAVGAMLLAVAGWSGEAFLGAFLFAAGGVVYGFFRKAEAGEMPTVIFVGGTVLGLYGGAMLGWLLGAILGAFRRR